MAARSPSWKNCSGCPRATSKQFDHILGNPNYTHHPRPDLRKQVDDIRANLGRRFDAFKKEIDGWLAKGRKTSADAGLAAKAVPGTQGHGQHALRPAPTPPSTATQRTARFKSLTQKVLGVMGEHMADYRGQDVKGRGQAVWHDQTLINAAKLNDRGHLVQLWPTLQRGRGIDAV